MDQDSGERDQEQEDQEHPVGRLGVFMDRVPFLQAADQEVNGYVQQGGRGVVPEQAGRVVEGDDLIGLEPAEKHDDEDHHRDVPGDQQEMLEPADVRNWIRAKKGFGLSPFWLL